MSASNDGGPAFPCHTNPLPEKLANAPQGMTLRDWFAGMALQGWLSGPCQGEVLDEYEEGTEIFRTHQRCVAAICYEYAEAMLAARKEGA